MQECGNGQMPECNDWSGYNGVSSGLLFVGLEGETLGGVRSVPIAFLLILTLQKNLIPKMKKLLLSLTMMAFGCMVMAVHVPQQEARQIAVAFYHNLSQAGSAGATVTGESVTAFDQVTTLYTFRFSNGGFVMVAADDASLPILGYSTESTMPEVITDPSVKAWVEGYSKEIYAIITHQLGNAETVKAWDRIRQGATDRSVTDVNPLLTTTWDQGCFYNALCPADAGQCGHVWTGCVATAMSQIMKYHNFPPQGVGFHSYVHPVYGLQSANFGATTYNWSSMPNSVGSSNTPVATLMYHAGVSVDMQYGTGGSGAFSTDVPGALMDYFNYHPGVEIKFKNNYPNVEDFKNLLRADLDKSLPVYYSGVDGTEGHAWVCDGYRMSDGMFHFNWGWSGSSNGWYAIGALNPGGYQFNTDNEVVLHIKPYNANLIVRISHPVNNAVIGVGYPVDINAKTVHGTPTVMKLFIDSVLRFSVASDSLHYTWNTVAADLGSHLVQVYSYSATDTVYNEININVAEWITQNSSFTTVSRGINYMSAVDSNIVWASAYDDVTPTGPCSDFTRSLDGGATWTPGTIPGTTGLASSMIFALSATKAYVAMYKVSGTSPMGIYMTADGGATWSRQASATFSNSASFPDCIHFFNDNEGWCMGDPINGEYEIYTTTNGGTTWTQVSGANIPNPLSGEFGIVGYYSAVKDTIWFGTSAGRVYRSTDKGHTYTVSAVPALSGKYVEPSFRTGMHGLAQDKSAGSTGAISETFDGGNTWTAVTTTGPVYATDVRYVPGTANTWVSSGSTGNMGSSYSFDGGHTWTDFVGTQGARYMQMAWVNNHCGWAGGVNVSATENGVYKFIGMLSMPLPAPTNLQAVPSGHTVHLTWNAPVPGFSGYNMYRDGIRLNPSLITSTVYDDQGVVSGHHTYCVTAVYPSGESLGSCADVDVAVGIFPAARAGIRIYPNPASTVIRVETESGSGFVMLNDAGREVLSGTLKTQASTIDISSLPSGIYVMRIPATGQVSKFVIIH